MENLEIKEIENGLVVKNLRDFEPEHIFECGQAFNWKKEEDASYTTVAYGKILNVKKDGEEIIFNNTDLKDFENIWYNYFDLKRDYGKIKKELSKDATLKEAVDYGQGIRILNQEPFETLISFIISANNQIPRIKNSIKLISKNYGEYIGSFKGEDYYSFPDAKKLSQVDVEELREVSRIGFRDKRVIDTSRMIAEGEFDLDEIWELSKDDGKKKLMELPGVGPKVGDCVLLFAFDKGDAFPVDVWVGRIMRHFYTGKDMSNKEIGEEADKLFGELAGFAQQYLFYYAREEDIGK